MVFRLLQIYLDSQKYGRPYQEKNNFPCYNWRALFWWLPILAIVFQLSRFHPTLQICHHDWVFWYLWFSNYCKCILSVTKMESLTTKITTFPDNSTPLIWWLPILSIVFQLVYSHPICKGGHTKVWIINEIQVLLRMNFLIN